MARQSRRPAGRFKPEEDYYPAKSMLNPAAIRRRFILICRLFADNIVHLPNSTLLII
jgi:hypothetical protein